MDLKISDLAKRSDDPQYPFMSTGKKEAVEPICLDKRGLLKGNLHFVAEFVPALALSGVSFESEFNELDKVVEESDNGSAVLAGTREAVPDGVTTSHPLEESDDEYQEEKKDEKKLEEKGNKKGVDSGSFYQDR